MRNTLVIIPARGGSKGLPQKNIKLLHGKPLIQYSIDFARYFFNDKDICVSTDDSTIVNVVNNIGLKVPFMRPSDLATDNSSTYDVIKHALTFYNINGKNYDYILLLQPTSPFRLKRHITNIFNLADDKTDMVVSVGVSKLNPYFTLFEEDISGNLKKSKESDFTRRQDCPEVYYYNGSIYLIKVESIKNNSLNELSNIRKYVMEESYCLDIDTEIDFMFAQLLMDKNLMNEEL